MKTWYNPALKTNKDLVVQAAVRNVKYPGIMSYTSKALNAELPIMNGAIEDQANRSFVNLGFGIDADNSSDKPMNVSTAMMSLSWALPLNYNETYLAAGFQAGYTFSRFNYSGYNQFPPDFDQNGPAGRALKIDQLQTGYTYQYFSAGVGASIFHTGLKRQWYLGGSVLHFNQPNTDKYNPASYRLPINYRLQAGYSAAVNELNTLGIYGSFSWMPGNPDQIVGGNYIHNLGDSTNSFVILGIAYRIGSAILPNAGIRYKDYRFIFYYELNVFRHTAENYGRQSFEFSISVNL